jgi:hypothetical protein
MVQGYKGVLGLVIFEGMIFKIIFLNGSYLALFLAQR